MSKKKECTTEGCTSPAQKDGLCYRCYKKKYGKAPFPSMDGKKKKVRTRYESKKKTTIVKEKTDNESAVENAVNEIKRSLKSQIEAEVRPMIDEIKTQINTLEEWFAS